MSTKPHPPPPKTAPHHIHALVKASAKHLFNQGHINHEQHREIVKHAEKGMKAARGKRGERE